MRYFHKHLLIASGISAVLLNPAAGIGFYFARELRDWQRGLKARGIPRTPANLKHADWPGFLWPVLPLSAAWCAMMWFLVSRGVPGDALLYRSLLVFMAMAAAGLVVRDIEKEKALVAIDWFAMFLGLSFLASYLLLQVPSVLKFMVSVWPGVLR